MGRPIVVTGGGTGGHVFPMEAIAEQLQAAGLDSSDLRFVGSRRGKERELLANSGVALTLLPGRGIRRSLTVRALADNVVAVAGLVAAVAQAVALLARWRPRVVVSVGGYAAVATDVAAVLTRRRLVLVNFDATPGAAHRLVLPFATRICTAFASADRRAVVTGAPLRAAIENVDRSTTRVARASRGDLATARWTIVVMTGSLGARSVNVATVELATLWRDRGDIRLIHVTGERDYEMCRERWHDESTDQIEYEVVRFADMATVWPVADLAICRAGAMTVAELAYLGVPAILVPLPGAPDDHQTHNANALVDVGGAVIVVDHDVTGAHLAQTVHPLLDVTTLATMERGAMTLRHEHAARSIASEVLKVAA